VNTQKLYHVDAFVGDVCRLDPNTGYTEVVHLNDLTTFAIPYKSDPNSILISVRKDVRNLNFRSGETEVLGTVEPGTAARFNDAKCDTRGRLWAGTVVANESKGHLYRMDSEYKFISYAENIVLSNGLTWSLNNETMYFNDSEGKKILAFDFNLEEGTATNQRTLFDFNDKEFENLGVPDGMTIDIQGKLWVCCYGGSCVLKLDPETKSILEKVDMPARKVTSCCFGGPHFDILYVTTGGGDLTDEEKARTPKAGAVFSISGHGTRGQPLNHYVN